MKINNKVYPEFTFACLCVYAPMISYGTNIGMQCLINANGEIYVTAK